MRQGQASRTAEYNAAFRAVESAGPAASRVLHDPYSDRLLPADLRTLRRVASLPVIGRSLISFIDRRWPGMRASVVARTRLIDDWLSDAMGVPMVFARRPRHIAPKGSASFATIGDNAMVSTVHVSARS